MLVVFCFVFVFPKCTHTQYSQMLSLPIGRCWSELSVIQRKHLGHPEVYRCLSSLTAHLFLPLSVLMGAAAGRVMSCQVHCQL